MASILCVGHAVEDHIFRVPAMPTDPIKYQAQNFEIVGGGPAANAAVAIARLGGDASLIARLGDDGVGRSIIDDLVGEGVDCTNIIKISGRTSSVSAVMVDGEGQRMIINYLDPKMPDIAAPFPAIDPLSFDAVLADVRWPDGALMAFERAKAHAIPTILDADYPVPKDGKIIAAADYVAFSAEGLRGFSGHDDLEQGLHAVAAQYDGWFCVTDGPAPVLILSGGEIAQVPAPSVDVVDTLGAGDIWRGAFALGLAEGMQAAASVKFANCTAVLKVTRPGGRRGAPRRGEVDEFLENWGRSHATGERV